MIQQRPSLPGPQWHQGQSPRLCPLWLQGQLRLSFSLSWQSFTLSRTLHPGLRLLRCLRPPSHTLAFLRPLTGPGGIGLPKFRDVHRIEVPLGACYEPGAFGTTYRLSTLVGTTHHPFWVRCVRHFTCSHSRSVKRRFLASA